jgi:hypothetical protein
MYKRAGVLIGLALCAAPARAQTPAPRATVHAYVTDAAGTPVPDAELVVVRGDSDAVHVARTDSAGHIAFTMELADARYSVLIRKIGFLDVQGPLAVANGDTANLRVTFIRLATSALDTVRVRANRRVLSSDYHLTAADIANSTRPLLDGLDILAKLRPEMLGDAWKCPDPPAMTSSGPLAFASSTGGMPRRPMGMQPMKVQRRVGTEHAIVQFLWINGQRVSVGGVPAMSPESLLVQVHPEHVAEMTYTGCYDSSVPLAGGRNALFVILKPGYVFDYNDGTHLDSATALPLRRTP